MWKILAQASTRGILALGVAGMIVLAGTCAAFLAIDIQTQDTIRN